MIIESAQKPAGPQTPEVSLPKLAAAIGVKELHFKREDLHPLGSHKGRSIPHMIDAGLADGIRHFAISSSGNAALAATLYVKSLNETPATQGGFVSDPITLEIFAGRNINSKKLARLQALKGGTILMSVQDRPKQTLFQKTRDPSVRSLRQSTDETALEGYASLALELSDIAGLEAVFIGTSSGTTAQALAQYFLKNKKNDKKNTDAKPVEIHIVQTPSCHPLVTALGTGDENLNSAVRDEISIADAIVDRTAERGAALIPLIGETGGAGWIADNESLRIAMDLTKKHAGVAISPNSALSVAGLMNAVYTGRTWEGAVVCMICGD